MREGGLQQLRGAGLSGGLYGTVGCNHLCITLILAFLRVGAHAVAAQHVALVFDGAGSQQGAPDVGAGGGPVGHIQQDVVAELPVSDGVAAPHREAEVVTDLRILSMGDHLALHPTLFQSL